MPNIKDRIKELRKEYGYTQEELAKKLGLNAKSSIANYENGSNSPSDEIKFKMCELFNCSMDYLMGNTNFRTYKDALNNYIKEQNDFILADFIEKHEKQFIELNFNKEDILGFLDTLNPTKEKFSIKSYAEYVKKYLNKFEAYKRKDIYNLFYEALQELNEKQEDFDIYHNLITLKEKEENQNNSTAKIIDTKYKQYYMCPVYGQIPAGEPNWAEECIEGKLPIDPNMMNIVDPEECYFLRVNGESMNKVIANGAYALIRKTDWVENGEIAVVLVNGYDATLKKFTKQGDLIILEPISTDPSIQTQVYDKNTSINVIGKYIGKFELKN